MITFRDSIHVIQGNGRGCEGLESLQLYKLAEASPVVGIELADVIGLLTVNKDVARCMFE